MATENKTSSLLPQLFWRLHFWSGLVTAPIVLFAAFSGLLYIFTPQIEAWRHASLDRANAIAPVQSLDRQIAAAQQAFPGKTIRSIVPSVDTEQTTQIFFGEKKKRAAQSAGAQKAKSTMANGSDGKNDTSEEHAQHQHNSANKTASASSASTSSLPFIAYVNAGTLEVQGSIAEEGRFKEWARKLHSTFLQGESWRWLIELGACWMLFMLVSGVYLWWPRGSANWRSVFVRDRRDPSTNNKSRRDWRYFHSIVSISSLLLTFTIIITGITWAKYAGDNFRQLQSALGQSSPKAPMQLRSTPNEHAPLSAQAIYDITQKKVPGIQMQLTPPKTDHGVWRIESFDRTQPAKRFQMSVDAYSGEILYFSGWQDLPLLAKATAVGIPFHRGEFGWWNQALLVVVALSVIFAVISGFVMWLKRRKPQTISAPKVSNKSLRAVPLLLWITLAVFAYALPVFGISLVILIVVEILTALIRSKTSKEAAA
ncbi:PepSY domain-containing protein [Undibacterium cyanobacteriorum]|uniref:PepSY domain-containing protein n=1 Tax=Undibacterium cyanobacteriorum TaxID=3073561 RepID=A0ABY9RL04_9BURK|nr:PepSY domain-containing protein [Undibacterium sp. 20NA77.5]WMW81907.1 PepSY domain-containing protein [Undibacterium sp. 20NA77.5]